MTITALLLARIFFRQRWFALKLTRYYRDGRRDEIFRDVAHASARATFWQIAGEEWCDIPLFATEENARLSSTALTRMSEAEIVNPTVEPIAIHRREFGRLLHRDRLEVHPSFEQRSKTLEKYQPPTKISRYGAKKPDRDSEPPNPAIRDAEENLVRPSVARLKYALKGVRRQLARRAKGKRA